VEQLVPGEQDYFVLKPKHSGFYQTPLELLLKHFGTKRLILTGLSTNSCVLFTASDAYMRDLQLIVPRDCVAACNEQEQNFAIEQIASDAQSRCFTVNGTEHRRSRRAIFRIRRLNAAAWIRWAYCWN